MFEQPEFKLPPGERIFDGSTYKPKRDNPRLKGQSLEVFSLMKDSAWRTLYEIEEITGHNVSSVSARLRDYRKPKFGGHTVNRRLRGISTGLWEYQLILKTDPQNL